VVTISEWVAFSIGIVSMLVATEGGDALGYLATGIAGIWVLGATAVPSTVAARPLVLDALTLFGVILTMTAITLTGGSESGYYLLSRTPAIRGAVFGGARIALAASGLSSLLLLAITLARGDGIIRTVGLSALYIVMAVTVAQIRRILVDLNMRAVDAEASSSRVMQRLGYLEQANDLLAKLAEIFDNSAGKTGVGSFKTPYLQVGDYDPHFRLALMGKDLHLAAAEAERRSLGCQPASSGHQGPAEERIYAAAEASLP